MMWMSAALVLLAVSASCKIICPDRKSSCPDLSTCCPATGGRYACCPVPRAVCCADKQHCCPPGYRCSSQSQSCVREGQPWDSIPLLQKVAADPPSSPVLPVSLLPEVSGSDGPPVQSLGSENATVVHCDNYYYCPDATTCCKHPTGVWFCCPYYPGRCCLDGYHCCQWGYDCDVTYTKCIRQGARYPFLQKQASTSVPATRKLSSNPDNQE